MAERPEAPVHIEPTLEPAPAAAADGEAAAGPPWRAETDALLQALVWLCAHHGRDRSALALLDGQALPAPLEPVRAAELLRPMGFEADAVRRPLAEVHALLFPLVLELKDHDAAVVLRRLPAQAGPSGPGVAYELVMPAAGNQRVVASEEELAASATGVLLLASPRVMASPDESGAPAAAEHWLWGSMRRLAPYYQAAMLAALLSNVLMLTTGLFTSVVLDKVIPHQAFATLWAVGLGALGAVAFDLAARQLRNHLIDTAGKKADIALGATVFRHTLSLRMEQRPNSAGSFAHQVSQVETVRDFCASATLAALSDLPFALLFIVMTAVLAGPLAWVLVVAAPLVLGLALAMQVLMRRSAAAQMREQADLHGLLVEAVEGLEDLKAAGAQGQFLRRYERGMLAAAAATLRQRALSSWINNVAAVMQPLVIVVTMVWGAYLIRDGALTAGALMAAVMFGSRAMAPLGSVVALAGRWQAARAAFRALDRVMQLPQERSDQNPLATPKLGGQLALREVNFAYPGRDGSPGHEVLRQVSLSIQPGERVALLGRIGSGKSTVLRLLGGLYQPSAGQVLADGIDLRQLDALDFRAQVGLVTQEPKLFNASLRDNVLLGRVLADAGQFAEVARLTGLDRVAAAHPQGYAAPAGESGNLLSGGQRQLVALARALVTRPRILLLDEPTSSMDAQSELVFVRQLAQAMQGCTLVAVTHRPALLELVDRVVVLDNGKVVLDGPKAKVLAALSGGVSTKPTATPAASAAGPLQAAPAASAPAASAEPTVAAAPAESEAPVREAA